MTSQEALAVMKALGMFFRFEADEALGWTQKLCGLSDTEAAHATVHALTDEAQSTFPPAWGNFRAIYNTIARRMEEHRSEQRLALGDGEGLDRYRAIPPSQGKEVARKAYEREYKRPAPTVIFALPDPDVLPETTVEDLQTVEAVCMAGSEYPVGWMACYMDVYKAMGRDHRRARAACRSMERSGRLDHRNNGVLVLLRKP